jgi:mRNA interferase RelE/StbE
MNYRLLLHKSVSKFLEKCNHKQKTVIQQKFALLQSNPFHHPQLDIKVMQGYNGLYRLRIGQYRLIYQVKDDELLIFIISMGNRGDVYKPF